jgi:hypothetical protein
LIPQSESFSDSNSDSVLIRFDESMKKYVKKNPNYRNNNKTWIKMSNKTLRKQEFYAIEDLMEIQKVKSKRRKERRAVKEAAVQNLGKSDTEDEEDGGNRSRSKTRSLESIRNNRNMLSDKQEQKQQNEGQKQEQENEEENFLTITEDENSEENNKEN